MQKQESNLPRIGTTSELTIRFGEFRSITTNCFTASTSLIGRVWVLPSLRLSTKDTVFSASTTILAKFVHEIFGPNCYCYDNYIIDPQLIATFGLRVHLLVETIAPSALIAQLTSEWRTGCPHVIPQALTGQPITDRRPDLSVFVHLTYTNRFGCGHVIQEQQCHVNAKWITMVRECRWMECVLVVELLISVPSRRLYPGQRTHQSWNWINHRIGLSILTRLRLHWKQSMVFSTRLPVWTCVLVCSTGFWQ